MIRRYPISLTFEDRYMSFREVGCARRPQPSAHSIRTANDYDIQIMGTYIYYQVIQNLLVVFGVCINGGLKTRAGATITSHSLCRSLRKPQILLLAYRLEVVRPGDGSSWFSSANQNATMLERHGQARTRAVLADLSH